MTHAHKSQHASRHGGPGSSGQNAHKPVRAEKPAQPPGDTVTATSDSKSHTSGGGGERDYHHSHDPRLKGGKPKP
jgi:hypothetical protein